MSARNVDTDAKRIAKFVQRADRALESPIYALTDPQSPGFPIKLNVRVEHATGETAQIVLPDITVEQVESAVVRCRPFLLPGEDNYLPDVVKSLQAVGPDSWQERLAGIAAHVSTVVDKKNLTTKTVFMTAAMDGQPETDTGLLSDGEVAMHYIYGDTVHQDEDRRAVLEVLGEEAVRLLVIIALNTLLKNVGGLRHVINEMGLTTQLATRTTEAP